MNKKQHNQVIKIKASIGIFLKVQFHWWWGGEPLHSLCHWLLYYQTINKCFQVPVLFIQVWAMCTVIILSLERLPNDLSLKKGLTHKTNNSDWGITFLNWNFLSVSSWTSPQKLAIILRRQNVLITIKSSLFY